MEPVRFTAAPESAFNWDRPPSDLLQSRLKHFRHLEKKLGLAVDPELGRRLGTENGAARYIAAVTRALRSRGLAGKGISGVATMPPPAVAASEPLSLAASGAEAEPPSAGAGTTASKERGNP